MKSICKELGMKPSTIHSLHRRFRLLPEAIVANKHARNPKDPFKTKVMGREVLYSGRTVNYLGSIKQLNDNGHSYNNIAKRKDILNERKLIELLHEANLDKDPLRKNEDFFTNFNVLINLLSRKVGGADITYYSRLSQDAAAAFKKYESVNQEIERQAYAANFQVGDLIEKKRHSAIQLSLLYEMMRAVLRKIGDLARQDNGFKKEVVEILTKKR